MARFSDVWELPHGSPNGNRKCLNRGKSCKGESSIKQICLDVHVNWEKEGFQVGKSRSCLILGMITTLESCGLPLYIQPRDLNLGSVISVSQLN